ncbi:MAG: hypothetical protein V1495_03625 [Pseudomonadota bacterium]
MVKRIAPLAVWLVPIGASLADGGSVTIKPYVSAATRGANMQGVHTCQRVEVCSPAELGADEKNVYVIYFGSPESQFTDGIVLREKKNGKLEATNLARGKDNVFEGVFTCVCKNRPKVNEIIGGQQIVSECVTENCDGWRIKTVIEVREGLITAVQNEVKSFSKYDKAICYTKEPEPMVRPSWGMTSCPAYRLEDYLD